MSGLLLRVGGLLIVADIVYLAAREALGGGADDELFRTILGAGAVFLGGGGVLRLAARAKAGLAGPFCQRCGRKIPRGRVHCDDHRAEALNEYRDLERSRHD